ncbi:MAG TPA: PAS domain S-box protein [Kofleriaceae bacterium]
MRAIRSDERPVAARAYPDGRRRALHRRARHDRTPCASARQRCTELPRRHGVTRAIRKVSAMPAEVAAAQVPHEQDESLFRTLVDSVTDYAIFALDAHGNVSTWNSGAERLKGYRADEIIGRHFSVFRPEEDVRAGACERELMMAATEGRCEEEGWRVRKDGTRFWANVVITAMRDASHTLIGFAKVTRDLTERKKAEEQRFAAEQRARLLTDSVTDYAIFTLDPSGCVATWNTGAERIKGYKADEIIGSHFSRFYPREDVLAGKCERELEIARREGRCEDEGWRVRKDGSRFWGNVVISAIRDRDGVLVGFSKVTRDLTEHKRAEEERAALLALQEANRAKDEFLAMLGHELRNPLAPIVTALQLVKLRNDGVVTREHELIERQTKQMMRLVDDLLDVSRITRGTLQLQKEPLDLRHAIANAIESASPLLEQKVHELRLDVPRHPLLVDGDEARLVQVLANLLNNAAKYTPSGGHITLRVVETDRLTIEISDDGIGIDPVLLPRIFDPFVQATQDLARSMGGLGLGLALVRSLVRLHGGEVSAYSAGEGRGTTVTVRLPRSVGRPAKRAEATGPSEAISEKRRVLLVDDNEDARLILADLLAELGHEVRCASDGVSALALLDEFTPEVAILDIGLPGGIDGHELARRLRARLDSSHLRLIALSGYKQTEGAHSFDHQLLKPVETRRLLELVNRPFD